MGWPPAWFTIFLWITPWGAAPGRRLEEISPSLRILWEKTVTTSAVPAAPTARHPSLRAAHPTGTRLLTRTPAADLQLLFLGVNPVTAAAAIILAGCGVRGFTVLDPRPVTWDDAAAGAYDLPDVGRSRDHSLRQRLLAANPQALAGGRAELFPGPDRPGTLVIRARSTGITDPTDDDAPLAAAASHLAEDHLVLDVISVEGHPPGTTMVWPVRPWYARACSECVRAAAGTSPREPARTPRHEAWPSHTAVAAAVTAQQVLAAATSTLVDPSESLVTVLRPGAPLSTVDITGVGPEPCAWCSPG